MYAGFRTACRDLSKRKPLRLGSSVCLARLGKHYPYPDLDSLLELKNFLANIKQFANRNIIAGYIYPKNQSPRYWMAATIEAVAIVLAIVTTLTFREVLRRENKRLDQRDQNELGNQYTNEAGKKNFRYVL